MEDNQMDLTQALTTTGHTLYGSGYGYTWYPYISYSVTPPTTCSPDVHVFPCPHCDKCKCGQATVKRPKATK